MIIKEKIIEAQTEERARTSFMTYDGFYIKDIINLGKTKNGHSKFKINYYYRGE